MLQIRPGPNSWKDFPVHISQKIGEEDFQIETWLPDQNLLIEMEYLLLKKKKKKKKNPSAITDWDYSYISVNLLW